MDNTQNALRAKWDAVINNEDLPVIKESYRKNVLAVLLENQEAASRADARAHGSTSLFSMDESNVTGTGGFTAGSSDTGPTAGTDPILIALVRRAMPNLMAYDFAGVQPMSGPAGLIFAMRPTYLPTGASNERTAANEAGYNEVDTAFTGEAEEAAASDPQSVLGDVFSITAGLDFNVAGGHLPNGSETNSYSGYGMGTGTGEGSITAEMGFMIEKVTVQAKTRQLKAEWTHELSQDLKSVHGLDAESELSNILATEIMAEINREMVRTLYFSGVVGAQADVTTTGTFDLDTDSNGRWSVEKFKGLMFQIEREANKIAKDTRRGKGNFVVCSSDVASALAAAGVLDYAPAISANLNVDDTGNTFAGVLQGRTKVFIDPYYTATDGSDIILVGYKGSNAYDAGIFYCPYIPLQKLRAIDPNTFQPKMGFKTRYGMVANPYANGLTQDAGAIKAHQNLYFRKFKVTNLM